MAWPRTRYKTAAAGGNWTPTDMNGWQDQFIRADGIVADDLSSSLAGNLGLSQTGIARRAYGERLAEQSSPDGRNIVGSTLTIDSYRDAGLLFAYGEVDVRGTPGDSVSFRVIVGGSAQPFIESQIITGPYATYKLSPSFIPIATALASSAIDFRVDSDNDAPLWAQNFKLWLIHETFS
jgi:hypothetical protein